MPRDEGTLAGADIWLIHGNLQTPDVWAPIVPRLEATGLNVHLVDLWATLADSMADWARAFCADVRTNDAPRRYLLGYSLGGRLALHALLDAPDLWAGALLVSADIGIADAAQRARRRETDAAWARRFRDEPIEQVLADWNRQPVFGGRKADFSLQNVRDMTYLRELLVRMFHVYSKGTQRDLLPDLAAAALPATLWITGEEDAAFESIARRVAGEVPGASHLSIPDAAHRVPWDAMDQFVSAVHSFASARL
ncbi:MAG: alpha/beta fold hydrolase [Rhodothermales bacterium]